MRYNRFGIVIVIAFQIPFMAAGQSDTDPPASPVLNLVTVQPETGITDIEWTKSISADVAGYVIYDLESNKAFAFDTIRDPLSTSYTDYRSAAAYRIESYVVAAIDTAGNISPLSNSLNTIFAESQIDTCNKKITISWNHYSSTPNKVTGYRIFRSVNGEPYSETGEVSPQYSSFSTADFTTGNKYCYYVMAELDGGRVSASSKTCKTVKMQRTPDWINADYASISNDNQIELSFTIDPLSEIETYSIERKSVSDNEFAGIYSMVSPGEKIKYQDKDADLLNKYNYRLGAINNCGNPVVYSNISGNIVLNMTSENEILQLAWNSYPGWQGGIKHYKIFMDTGGGFSEQAYLTPSDTIYSIDYSRIMYEINTDKVCFYVTAYEQVNQYNIAGESRSNTVCKEIIVKITVPNAFTPDNDLLNDYFRPVLSFTPETYKLIISDRNNNVVFETSDPLASWDGTSRGSPLAQGLYLWYLNITSPSGKIITKTGTVTIVRNR